MPLSVSGTSSLMMRWARPSTMAVLPTPGSPINTGLFLERRCNICITRRISSSRPMTGSSLPLRASSVRSTQYFFSASRWPSASGLATDSPPRTALTASSIAFLLPPASLSSRPASPLSDASVSKNNSEEMYWSPSFCASLSVRLNRLFNSRDICTSPPAPSTLGKPEMACLSDSRRRARFTPARAASDAVPPSSCASSAESTIQSSRSISPSSWPVVHPE